MSFWSLSMGEGPCDMENDLRLLRCVKSRAMTASDRRGSDIKVSEFRSAELGSEAYADNPLDVIPGSESRRRFLRGGRERRFSSLNEVRGKFDIYKSRRDGRHLNISVKRDESIMPPGLQ